MGNSTLSDSSFKKTFGKEEADVTRDLEKANGMGALQAEAKEMAEHIGALRKQFPMKRYRAKPLIKEAVMFDGTPEMADYLSKEWASRVMPVFDKQGNYLAQMDIVTLEGTMRLLPGDFLVKGVKGELYPVKSDIFLKSYEEVTDND